MNVIIVPGILDCNILLISVCMLIVSKALLISCGTVIVRAGGAIWLNPFATVLFTLCITVTVECCVWYVFCYVSPVSLQLLRGGIWACMRSLVYVFVGFWDYATQLPYVWYYVGVKRSFQHACEECESNMA